MRFAKPFLILVLFLTAPAAWAQQSRPFANVQEAVDAMIAAVASRDANAIAGLYAEDAIVLSPNRDATAGRAAIRDSWVRSFAAGYSALRVGRVRTERGTDRAASVFVWEATIAAQGSAAQTLRGRTILYLKQVEGGWLISADMWQQAPA